MEDRDNTSGLADQLEHERVCSNFRGITLLSLPGKDCARVLARRICLMVEPWMQMEQCNFLPGPVTLDQLITQLSRILEVSWEFAQPVMCFLDLEKAYDRVPWGVLWDVL